MSLRACEPRVAQRNAHQLRALKPAPAQTYVPQRAHGALWPSVRLRLSRPVGCMRGLGSRPRDFKCMSARHVRK
jgi:hypothetical protein